MGTDKRARQKANRAARIEAAYETQRKEEARKRGTTAVVAVAVLAALIGIYLFATKDDDGELATGDTGGPASTVAGSVAGQPCVALADPLPAGAPEVPVPEGPAPAELIVEDLSEGDGEVIEAGATIKANYIGVACSTGKVFDDSYSKGAPIEFPLTGVVAGWSEGIPGMKVGGRRLLVIPPDKGYGDASPDPNIAPGETLVFVVEPTEVVSGGETTGGPATVPAPGPGASLTGDTPCPPAEGAERTTSFETAPPMCLTEGKSYSATFVTNKGDITVELDTERMPATSNNFVVLARYGYYDGTAIFRTDDSIDILQGGSPSTNSPGDPGPGYTVEDEGGEFDFGGDTGGTGPFTYTEGQLVMARSAGPNSSGAQFFLTAGPKVSALDAQGTYLVFGNVTAGLDIVKSILALHVPCADGDPSCIGGGPSEAITIDKVTITES